MAAHDNLPMATATSSLSAAGSASSAGPPDEAVLFLSNPLKFTRTEWQTWALQHMYKTFPAKLDEREASCMKFLKTRRRTPTYLPATQLTVVSAQYRIALSIDMSPSLCTPHKGVSAASSANKLVIETVWDGMQKLLLGVCQPFAIQGDAAGELYELRPEIFLTVLAEGTSDELGKGSVASLRVLAQGIHLTPGTVQRALGLLYAQLTRYELELSKATEKRVGSGAQPNNPDYNTQSALQACMFALDLLPKDAVPLIVLFSDGCSSLNDYTGAYDKSLLRELHQQDVACITVAMGATDPFAMLGRVADFEQLRFLALATGGVFAYSDDFPDHAPGSLLLRDEDELEDLSTLAQDMPSNSITSIRRPTPLSSVTTTTSKVLRRVGSTDLLPPNWYHRLILLRTMTGQLPPVGHRYDQIDASGTVRPYDRPSEINTVASPEQGHALPSIYSDQSTFPWDNEAVPPAVLEITARYKEYYLNVDLEHLLAARIRDGFRVQHVFLSGSGSSTKINIKLAYFFEANVVIEYKVKAGWQVDDVQDVTTSEPTAPSLSASLPQLLQQTDKSKSPRVEIDILSWPQFFYYFTQQKPPTSSTGQVLFSKTQRLHEFLNLLLETDRFLGHLAMFNSSIANYSVPAKLAPDAWAVGDIFDPHIRNHAHVSMFPVDKSQRNDTAFQTYWQTVAAMLGHKLSRWFDEDHKYFILRTLSLDRPRTVSPDIVTTNSRRLAKDKLIDFFKSWCSFILAKNVFVRFIKTDTDVAKPTGFCLVLLAGSSLEALISVRLAFFRTDVATKQQAIVSLREALDSIGDLVIVCTKPLSHLMEVICNNATATVLNETRLVDNNIISMATVDPAVAIAMRYLRKTTWSFFDEKDISTLTLPGKLSPVILAQRMIRAKRLEQGFVVVSDSSSEEHIVFYRELAVGGSIYDNFNRAWPSARERQSRPIVSVQYSLTIDTSKQTLKAELWIDPQVSDLAVDVTIPVRDVLLSDDRRIVCELYTFDFLHMMARSRGVTIQPVSTKLVNVATLLSINRSVYDSFKLISADQPNITRVVPFDQLRFPPAIGGTPEQLLSALSSSKSSPQSSLGTPVPNDPSQHIQLSTIGQLSTQHQANLVLCAFLERSLQARTQCEIPLQQMSGNLSELSMNAVLKRIDHFRRNTVTKPAAKGTVPISVAASSSAAAAAASIISPSLRVSPRGPLAQPELVLTTHLRDCKCYVHMIDDESFLLIILPTYTGLLQHQPEVSRRGSDENASLPPTPSSAPAPAAIFSPPTHDRRNSPAAAAVPLFASALSVFVFDCNRQQIITAEKPTMSMPSSKSSSNLESASTASSSRRSSFMSTSRGSGSRSGASSLRRQSQRHDEQDEEEDDDDDDDNGEHDEPLIVLSSASKRFIRAMREIHKACFVRGVYAATLQRLSVSIADMKMALDLCHEVPVEVDITHMLNVSTLGSRGVLGDSFVAPARDSVTAAFKTAIGKAFAPAAEMDMPERKYTCYYFVPSVSTSSIAPLTAGANIDSISSHSLSLLAADDEGSTVSNGTEGRTELSQLELVDASEHPMFLRLEVEITRPMKEVNDTDLSYACFSVDTLPLSFQNKRKDHDDRPEVDFTSTTINSLEAPFLPSGGTSVRLRLIAFVLSPHQRIDSDPQNKSSSYSSYFDITRRASSRDDSPEQSPTWDEADYGFKYESAIPPPKADPLQNLTELQKDVLISTTERVQRVVSKEILSMLLAISQPKETTIQYVYEQLTQQSGVATRFSRPLSFVYTKKGTAYFLDQLVREPVGPFKLARSDAVTYVVSGPRLPSAYDASISALSDSAEKGFPPFWLMLTVRRSTLHVHFFSSLLSEAQQKTLIDNLFLVVDQLVERVNQIILLEMMFVTRRCSSLLSAPAANAAHDASDAEALPVEDDESPNAGSFSPGQLACDLVFHASLPISWRLQGARVLPFFASQFEYLAVGNRANTYCYKSKDAIFYIMFSVPELPQADKDDKEASVKSAELRIDVYGLGYPSEEITEKFIQGVEARLAKQTLDALSTQLNRNITLKLTATDVDFIQPENSPPSGQRLFSLPDKVVTDPHLFLLYLKQNLVQYLHPLSSALDLDSLNRRFVRAAPSDELAVVLPGEFVFLFVGFQRTSTFNELASLGQGLAFVVVNIVEAASNQVRTSFPVSGTPVPKPSRSTRSKDVLEAIALLEQDKSLTAGSSGSYRLKVEVWMRGAVNVDNLLERVLLSTKQSSVDLLIERLATPIYEAISTPDGGKSVDGSAAVSPNVSRRSSIPTPEPSSSLAISDDDGSKATLMASEFLLPCRTVMDSSIKLGSPSVERQTVRFKTPRWMQEDLICELRDSLRDINSSFSALVLKCIGGTTNSALWRLITPQRRLSADNAAAVAVDIAASEKTPLSPQTNTSFSMLLGLDSVGASYGLCVVPDADQGDDFASTLSGRLYAYSKKSDKTSLLDDIGEPAAASGNSTAAAITAASRRSSISNMTTSRNTVGAGGSDNIMLYPDFVASADAKMSVQRSCFMIVDVTVNQLGFTLYNVNKSHMDLLAAGLTKLLTYVSTRVYFIESIFLQKMGLFLHIPNEPAPTAISFKARASSVAVSSPAPGGSGGSLVGGNSIANMTAAAAAVSSPQSSQATSPSTTAATAAATAATARLRPDNFETYIVNPFPARPQPRSFSSSSGAATVSSSAASIITIDRGGEGSGAATPKRVPEALGRENSEARVALMAPRNASDMQPRRQLKMPPSVAASASAAIPTTPPAVALQERDRNKAIADRELKQKRRKRVADLKVTFREGYPRVPLHLVSYAGIPDLATKHGLQMREVRIQESESARDEEVYQTVYNRWSARDKDKITANDLTVLLRCGRLIHSARSAILFSKLRDLVFVKSGNSYMCTLPSSMMRSNSCEDVPPLQQQQQQLASVSPTPLKLDVLRAAMADSNATRTGTSASTPAAVTPLATTPAATPSLSASPGPSSSSQLQVASTLKDELVRSWFEDMLSTFQQEYIAYLKQSIDLVEMLSVVLTGENPSPFVVAENMTIATPSTYLVKGYKAGVLLIEMTLEGMFVSMDMYTLHPRLSSQSSFTSSSSAASASTASSSSASSAATAEFSRQDIKSFNEQSTKIKNLMHVKSFTYDFHLRHLYKVFSQLAIASSSSSSPSSPSPLASATASLDYLDILKAFVRYNENPARYARNRIAQGQATFDDSGAITPAMLMTYVTQNSGQYGFTALKFRGVTTGLFMTSKTPDFVLPSANKSTVTAASPPRMLSPVGSVDSSLTDRAASSPATPVPAEDDGFRYLLVLYAEEDQPTTTGSLHLSYFVCLVSTTNTHPLLKSASRLGLNTVAHQRAVLTGSVASISKGAEVSIVEVSANAQTCIKQLLNDARMHFERDQQWNRLVTGKPGPSRAGLALDEYVGLKSICRIRSFEQIDPSLGPFLSAIRPAHEAFERLLKRFPVSREFRESAQKTIVVFFNPKSPDLLIEATLFMPPPATPASSSASASAQPSSRIPSGGVLQLAAIRRERTSRADHKNQQRQLEHDHVSAVVNVLVHFMWTKMLH